MSAAPAARPDALLWALPALLLVGLLVVVPQGWLVLQSVATPDGPTSAYYARLASPSYAITLQSTVELSLVVCIVTAVLGYPLAYLMASSSGPARVFLLALVLIPFATPLLVRTYGWLVILQRNGPLSDLLVLMGGDPRWRGLAYTFEGTVVGMVHIMLPFFVLPLQAVIGGIDGRLRQAALSLGASRLQAFLTIILPLSMPGVIAGMAIVFILSLGYYITPAILGGSRVLVWSMRIESAVRQYGDWGVAAAMSVVLLVATFALLAIAFAIFRLAARGRLA